MRGGERQDPCLRCPPHPLDSKIRTQTPSSPMTDDEFQRIKEAEKDRLRAKKRLRATLESLKRRNEVQSVVRRMSRGAKRLLQKTETFADKVASQAARQAARLEVAIDDQTGDDSLAEDEEVLREERAEALLRRLKTEEASSTRSPSSPSTAAEKPGDSDAAPDPADEGPDKTIGRMGDPRPDDTT